MGLQWCITNAVGLNSEWDKVNRLSDKTQKLLDETFEKWWTLPPDAKAMADPAVPKTNWEKGVKMDFNPNSFSEVSFLFAFTSWITNKYRNDKNINIVATKTRCGLFVIENFGNSFSDLSPELIELFLYLSRGMEGASFA